MSDIEVHIDFSKGLKRVGTLRRHARRGQETTSFEYHPDWLADNARFSLEPALTLNRGGFTPAAGAPVLVRSAIPLRIPGAAVSCNVPNEGVRSERGGSRVP
jgi:hypothetical protein